MYWVAVHRRFSRLLNPAVLEPPIIQFQVTLARGATRKPSNSPVTRRVRRVGRVFACAGLAKGAERAAESVTEEVQEWADDGGQTGADHADLGLDATPERDVGVFVGGVCDVADVGEVFQADHAADCDEEADEEGQDDADFAPLVLDLDFGEFADGEEKDHQIEEAAEIEVSHTAVVTANFLRR